MVLNRLTTRTFHKRLYAGQNPGWLSSITLTKRNSDQAAGTTTAYTLNNCRRKKVYHQGNPLLTAVAADDYTIFQIPREELDANNIDPGLINPLDRITDEDGYVWQPEADNNILLQLGYNFINVTCKRLPNASA